jgi:hypothetical protein
LLGGTLAYMSPEQARGELPAAPSDIFSVGVILYELLTGRHPFRGASPIDTAYAIAHSEPKGIEAVRDMPVELAQLIAGMLEKDPIRRPPAQEVEQRLKALERPGYAAAGFAWRRVLRATALLALVAAAVFGGFYLWRKLARPEYNAPVIRYAIALPPGQNVLSLNISPRGDQLAYAVRDPSGRRIYRRFLDSLESRVVPGSESGAEPFFSPGGEEVAFFLPDIIRIVGPNGRRDLPIPRVAHDYGFWGSDGYIYFNAYSKDTPGISRIRASGGKAETVLDSAATPRGYAYALCRQLLPDSGGLLYDINLGPVSRSVHWLDLKSHQSHDIVDHGSGGQILPTGHLLFWRNGSLIAAPFDRRSKKLAASPVEVVPRVQSAGWNGAAASVSENGTLAYVAQPPPELRKLVWAVPGGAATAIPLPPASYEQAEVSPDGASIAVVRHDELTIWSVWIYQLQSRAWTKLAEGGERPRVVWSPDSRAIVAALPRDSEFTNLYRIPLDAPGKIERLTHDDDFGQAPTSWSAAANAILFLSGIYPSTETDAQLLSLGGDRRPRLVSAATGFERSPSFSPDGRWIVYSIDPDGGIFVRDAALAKPPRRILDGSGDGSRQERRYISPLWVGNRIYFIGPSSELMELVVDATGQPAGQPHALTGAGFVPLRDIWTRSYSIAPDGRVLTIHDLPDAPRPFPTINVVVNWFTELNRLAPVP